MPAMPMKLAAERYSPEMALAFQPTETLRPATKKSLAVLDFFAVQKPMKMVAMTVRAEKARMYGSMFMLCVAEEKRGKGEKGSSCAGQSWKQPWFGVRLHFHEFA